MSSENTARNLSDRYPDFSSSSVTPVVHRKNLPLGIDFSELYDSCKAPEEGPIMSELEIFATPEDIKQKIKAINYRIQELFLNCSFFEHPSEQIDFIREKILSQQSVVTGLSEQLFIAQEIHGYRNSVTRETLELLNELFK